jgi:hypothetical protein
MTAVKKWTVYPRFALQVVYGCVISLVVVSSSMAERLSSADLERLKGVAATEQSAQLGSVRLNALLRTPERLSSLDQRNYLQQTGVDEQLVLTKTLALPQRLFPKVFASVTSSNAVISICLTDCALFMWRKIEEVDVLAMVPLKGAIHQQTAAQRLNVWFCATGEKTRAEWRQRPDGPALNAWLQLHVQELTGARLNLPGECQSTPGSGFIQGNFDSDPPRRSVVLRTTQRIMAIETVIEAAELDDTHYSPSPVAPESVRVPRLPILVPRNWPPKTDTATGD